MEPNLEKLTPSVQVHRPFFGHAQGIILTALVNPATNQVTDSIVLTRSLHKRSIGIDQRKRLGDYLILSWFLRS